MFLSTNRKSGIATGKVHHHDDDDDLKAKKKTDTIHYIRLFWMILQCANKILNTGC